MLFRSLQEEQIGEVRTVKSLGHEDYAKELYQTRAEATYKTRVQLAIVLAPLEGIVDSLFDGKLANLVCGFAFNLITLLMSSKLNSKCHGAVLCTQQAR